MEKTKEIISLLIQAIKRLDAFGLVLFIFNFSCFLYGVVTLSWYSIILNGGFCAFMIWSSISSIIMNKKHEELMEIIRKL